MKQIEKIYLMKIKDILINEYKKEYYRNAANVKEIIPFDNKEEISIINGKEYHCIKNIMIYNNDMPQINDFYLHIVGQDVDYNDPSSYWKFKKKTAIKKINKI